MTELVFDFADINRRMNRKRPLFLPVESVADLRAELDRTERELADFAGEAEVPPPWEGWL